MTQPGRDHWPRAVSLLFSGGGIPGGQVIGATDRHGADVTSRRVGVRDFLATIYRHLGIDAARLTLRDRTGRPVPALPDGRPIPELVSHPQRPCAPVARHTGADRTPQPRCLLHRGGIMTFVHAVRRTTLQLALGLTAIGAITAFVAGRYQARLVEGGRGPAAGRRRPALRRHDPLPAAVKYREIPWLLDLEEGIRLAKRGETAAADLDLRRRPAGALLRVRPRAP